MVGFCDLLGTTYAPVSKIPSFKYVHSVQDPTTLYKFVQRPQRSLLIAQPTVKYVQDLALNMVSVKLCTQFIVLIFLQKMFEFIFVHIFVT